jgi:hypothetical protein
MDAPSEPVPPDWAAIERASVRTTGVIGAIFGWTGVAGLYLLLRYHPRFELVARHHWAALACLAAFLGWGICAGLMRRHYARRRVFAARLAELLEQVGSLADGEQRARIEAAIEKTTDEGTRAFLLQHLNKNWLDDEKKTGTP